MSSKTTVTNPAHPFRYTDMNYPGNRFDIQDIPTYYQVSYSGVARQHDKYLALKRAIMEGIEHVLREDCSIALSSAMLALRYWAVNEPGGFTCEHMPWRVLVPQEHYRAFTYVLRAPDTDIGNAAYTSARRYGTWV